MRIIALIDDNFVIEKILPHIGLWEDEPTRGARPPPEPEATEITAEPILQDLPYGEWAVA